MHSCACRVLSCTETSVLAACQVTAAPPSLCPFFPLFLCLFFPLPFFALFFSSLSLPFFSPPFLCPFLSPFLCPLLLPFLFLFSPTAPHAIPRHSPAVQLFKAELDCGTFSMGDEGTTVCFCPLEFLYSRLIIARSMPRRTLEPSFGKGKAPVWKLILHPSDPSHGRPVQLWV